MTFGSRSKRRYHQPRGIFSKTACYLTPQDLVKEMGVEALTGKSQEVKCVEMKIR